MQVSVLASGSKGNAVFVAMDGVRLLIDAGISATRIKKGLAAEGIGLCRDTGAVPAKPSGISC